MIYVASPFFTEAERTVYRSVIRHIQEFYPGEDIYIPADHEIPHAWEMPNQEWGKAVFEMDLKALDKADTVVVINWGMYSDSGTAWECGYAYAKGKYVQMVFVGEQEDTSLMMVNGCHYHLNPMGKREVK